MRIALVRHGETDWNRLGRMQGRTDIPLNETGIEQMRRCGEALRTGTWSGVISSPLSRARQSAEIVAETLGILEMEPDSGLLERDYGEGTGLTAAERECRFPDGSCPGLESREAMSRRMTECLLRIAGREKRQDSGLIIISHGSAIDAFLRALSGETPCGEYPRMRAGSELPPGNGSITLLSYGEGRFHVEGRSLIRR